jgi:hypothetical protein
MAFSLPLNPAWSNQRWKVKIRDRERLEPPRGSILRDQDVAPDLERDGSSTRSPIRPRYQRISSRS